MLLTIFTIGLFGNIFLYIFFPKEYNLALLTGSFYIILFYSYCEIYIKKMFTLPQFKFMTSFIMDNFDKKDEIEIIKFNETIYTTDKQNIPLQNVIQYDLLIFSDYEHVNEISPRVNKKMFSGAVNLPLSLDYTLFNYKFIAVTVKINNKAWPIKLVDDNENYYIVGNKLNLYSISYLLKKQHNVICDEMTTTYELTIIDNNVNMNTCSEKDEIILQENAYDVIPFMSTSAHNVTLLDIYKKTQ